MSFLGIEIGGTKLQLVAGAADKIVQRRRLAVDGAAGAEGIRRQIAAELPGMIEAGAVAAIGVGFGGPVDWRTGRVARSHQVEGWTDFALAEWLGAQTALPVRVDNDANVAALAEATLGAGKDADPLFYVTLGSGVGGGLVIGGAIYHGAVPGECEIGHVRLTRDGVTVESRCSGWAVDRRIREARTARPESAVFGLIGRGVGSESAHLAAAYEAGDALAQEIIASTAEDLAFALGHVVHLLHPAMIVLGGGLSLMGEPLREAVARALAPLLMEGFRPGPQIMLSSLREDAVPAGALLLAEEALNASFSPRS
jgi:glucokinase